MWTSNVRDSEYNTQIICLTYMYVYTPDLLTTCDAIGIFTQVADARDLAAVYRREESKMWSYKLSNIPKSGFYAATWCLCSKG